MKMFIFHPTNHKEVFVTAFLQDEAGLKQNIPAVIVCPGGAYEFLSPIDKEPVAKKFYGAGYHTFILNYSVKEKAKNFQPLIDLASAMNYIREHALEWNLDSNRIAVCGMSAGGHLAASLGTLYNEKQFLDAAPKFGNIRPDAMILIYPVITSDEYAHKMSIAYVSGDEIGGKTYQWFGLDKHVDETTPQTFLWHTSTDKAVPAENSMRFAMALSVAKVQYELHILPQGAHGLSTCSYEVGKYDPYNGRWVEWSITWLNNVFNYND